MTENVYEGLFILDANRFNRDQAGVAQHVSDLIEKQGGTVLVSRLWEERRLAYPIRGQRKGAYWLTYFRLAGEKVAALTEHVQRDDNVLRQLFLKVDPRIVETLVEHAKATTGSQRPAETPAEPVAVAASAPVEDSDDDDGDDE